MTATRNATSGIARPRFSSTLRFLAKRSRTVLARQLLEINWIAEPKLSKGATGDDPNRTFAKEQRELTVTTSQAAR